MPDLLSKWRRSPRILSGRLVRVALALTAASVAALVVTACVGPPTVADKKAELGSSTRKGPAMTQPSERKPTSVISPNLRPMAIDNRGQDYTVNGCLGFQMKCLGESKDYDYWFFAGVSGDAHTQAFTADTSKYCNCRSHIDVGPELVKTWYDAVGYGFTIVTQQQFNADRPRHVGELMKHIDRGVPIIAKQNTEENGDYWLLVGYEDGGGQLVLVTDNTRGAEARFHKVPTNQQVSYLFILPGAKKQAPPLAEVCRKAVLNIPTLLTRAKKGDVCFGREAFEAWADHLLAEDYAGLTDDQLDLWKLHNTYVCTLSTNAACRAFPERAAKLCPDLPFLADVASGYTEMGGNSAANCRPPAATSTVLRRR